MLLVLGAAPETCLLRSPALVSLCVPQVSPMDTYFYSHLLLLFLFSVIVPDNPQLPPQVMIWLFLLQVRQGQQLALPHSSQHLSQGWVSK